MKGNKTFIVHFRYPQAPRNERPPKNKAVAIPRSLIKDTWTLKSSVDRWVFIWMAATTYGEHRRTRGITLAEVSKENDISLERAAKAIKAIQKAGLAEISACQI